MSDLWTVMTWCSFPQLLHSHWCHLSCVCFIAAFAFYLLWLPTLEIQQPGGYLWYHLPSSCFALLNSPAPRTFPKRPFLLFSPLRLGQSHACGGAKADGHVHCHQDQLLLFPVCLVKLYDTQLCPLNTAGKRHTACLWYPLVIILRHDSCGIRTVEEFCANVM